MKILDDEIKRRYEEKRNAKTSLWSNWLIKVILLVLLIFLMKYLGDLHDSLSQEPVSLESEIIDD